MLNRITNLAVKAKHLRYVSAVQTMTGSKQDNHQSPMVAQFMAAQQSKSQINTQMMISQQRNFSTKVPKDMDAYMFYPERGCGPEAFNNPKMEAIYQRSITDREGFYGDLIDTIKWTKRPEVVLDHSDPYYRNCWYPDGEMSIVYNAIDVHVDEGRGDDIAYHYYSAYTGREESLTFKQMQDESGRLASVMKKQFDVQKGDTVILYMPMVMEAITMMIAIARLGAIHCVVFGGFAPKELAIRLDDCKPKLICTSSMGIEPSKTIPYLPFVEEAVTLTKEIDATKIPRLYYNRPEQNGKWADNSVNDNPMYHDYVELMAQEKDVHPCVPVKSTDPLYILYTSGTTGAPKGIVRDTAGTAVALKYSMENYWDARRGDCQFSTSDIGWIVGHSFIVWGPALNNVASVVFEGKPHYPNAGILWELCKKYNVTSIFTAPTAMRLLKKEDHEGEYLKKWGPSTIVKGISFAGERMDPDTIKWVRRHMPYTAVNDTWWQTEIGYPIAGDMLNQAYRGPIYPTLPGTVCKPGVGFDIKIFNDDNTECGPNELGKVVVKLPMPPQMMLSIWQRDDAFIEKYMTETPGYYTSGDAGAIDEYGYLSIMTRVDDVINMAAHRISTGRLEEVLMYNQKCSETAIVGFYDDLKGECPLAFVVLANNVDQSNEETLEAIKKELNANIRKDVGAFASLIGVIICDKLPKTRSGKITRGTVRKIAESKPYTMPPTLEDESSIQHIEDKVAEWKKSVGRS